MRLLIQRVKKAGVKVEGRKVAEIGRGLLLFVGIGRDDDSSDIEYLSKKISGLRIFEDENGKMNLDVRQAGGRADTQCLAIYAICGNTKGQSAGVRAIRRPGKGKRVLDPIQ